MPQSDGEMTQTRRGAFEAATEAFHHALRTNDAEALFEYVSDDVRMMPPGEPVIRGKDAMRDWYAGFLSLYHTTSLALSDREVLVGEGWAVELGSFEWELQPTGGGESLLDRGNYIQVWGTEADGRWMFAREIWNSSASAPA